MVTTGQQTAYRCEQCGSPEIVALSLLYEQGTRSFSGRFTSGVSQSYTAKAALRRLLELSASMFGMGIRNILLCLLGNRRLSWDIAASAKSRIPRRCSYIPILFGLNSFIGYAFPFPQNFSLQPRGLSHLHSDWAAHLHVPPLRKILSDSSVATGASSLREFASNAL